MIAVLKSFKTYSFIILNVILIAWADGLCGNNCSLDGIIN